MQITLWEYSSVWAGWSGLSLTSVVLGESRSCLQSERSCVPGQTSQTSTDNSSCQLLEIVQIVDPGRSHQLQLWVSTALFCWNIFWVLLGLWASQQRVFCALLIHWTKYWWFTSTNKKYFVSVRTIETMSIIALRLFMIASWTSEIHHLGNHLAVVVQDDCLVLYERCLCW